MKTKNVKVKTAKVLANESLKLGKMSVDSACCYIYHQPKMPEALKKMKNSTNTRFLGSSGLAFKGRRSIFFQTYKLVVFLCTKLWKL